MILVTKMDANGKTEPLKIDKPLVRGDLVYVSNVGDACVIEIKKGNQS